MRLSSTMSPSVLAFATVTLAVGLLAGCGGGSDSTSTTAGASQPAAATTPAAAADDCAAAQPEIEAGAKATGFVTAVEVASCDKAVIKTSLGTSDANVGSATGICAIAANEASSHGVAAVSIVSEDGTELATGTNSGDCAGVPQS